MFQYRSSAFGPSVAAIQKHLGAVEKELENIGRIAGDRTSAAAATASDQIGDAISTILNEMVERFRQGRQAAGDQAGRLSNQALNLGAKYGSDALRRAASEVETRPLVTIGLIANQLALTYDIRNMPTENFLKLLPEEFSARW